MYALREAKVGDRVYWLGDHIHPPRDGTVAEFITQGAAAGLLAIEWDAKVAERLGPFWISPEFRTPAIPRHVIHPAELHVSTRWGFIDERDQKVAHAMELKAHVMAAAA